MTAQIPDMVRYKGKRWELIGVECEDAEELFEPRDHGFQPRSNSSACWRGHQCYFAVAWGEIYLAALDVWEATESRPQLGGVGPQVREYWPEPPYPLNYPKLHVPLQFTGSIRLARDFDPARYEHMGFQAPCAYFSVLDLRFEHGHLVEHLDRSAEIGHEAPLGERPPGPVDMVGWIDERFARRM